MSELPQAPNAFDPPPRPDAFAPPRPVAPRRGGRLGRIVVVLAALAVLFWGTLAVLIGTGRVSLRADEPAPFGIDDHPLANTALAPRDLLPPALGTDQQMTGPATSTEATATYIGERAETRVTVRRYADEAAARAAVIAGGRAVPEPKQQRERVGGTRARDYYQYDGGNPGRSGFIYASGPFVVTIESTRAPTREAYAKACPY